MSAKFFTYVLVMAGVTYIIRMLPLVLCKKKIENKFVKSFLFYVPYAVLAAMTIPDIFYSTSNITSAVLGLIVAILLAIRGMELLPVALASCGVVYVTELAMKFIG